MGLAGLTALPFAAYLFMRGEWSPLGAALVLLGSSGLSYASHHARRQNAALIALMLGFAATGFLLSIALEEISGVGFGIALLAPALGMMGAVQNQTSARRKHIANLGWVLLAVVGGSDFLGSFGLISLPCRDPATVRLVAGCLFGAMGASVGYAGMRLLGILDIYQRGQLNAYRHLVDQMQETVIRYDQAGRLIYVSRAAEGLFGCRRYELTETTLVERVHVQDRPLFLSALDMAARAGEPRTIELRLRQDRMDQRQPSFVWVEITSTAVSTGSPGGLGARHEVVLLVRDITARREREAELRRAWRAAEEASLAKSRFLSTMGHELRTPLNAILGFSDMLAAGVGGQLNAQQLDYTQMIQQSGRHMTGLISTLLDMSRLEAGKFELATDAFPPDSVVDPVFRMLDQMAAGRKVRLTSQYPRPLPLLVADERACRQILINLVSNAIKFSAEGGLVTVTVKRQGRHIAFAVTDEGIGMDSETIKHLGEPFFQAQDGLARLYEGTGLGLSIVKGLVELHDGHLSVRSAPNEGTTVTVMLPINGPETKLSESHDPTPIRPEVVTPLAQWPAARKSAL